MDKKTTISRFLKEGFLLSPAAAEAMTTENIPSVLAAAKASPGLIIPPPPSLTVAVRSPPQPTTISPAALIGQYTTVYTTLRGILALKLSAVSIANIPAAHGPVAAIGMVRESTSQGFLLEDTTGQIPVVSRKHPDNGDVIGVAGLVREGQLFEQEIHYPDITVFRERAAIHQTVVLSTTSEQGELVITPTQLRHGDAITTLPNPATITISDQTATITILISAAPATLTDAIRYLKKRHLLPPSSLFPTPTLSLIDPVPDLFWVVSPHPFQGIYKGVTIVSLGSTTKATVDLRTMAVDRGP